MDALEGMYFRMNSSTSSLKSLELEVVNSMYILALTISQFSFKVTYLPILFNLIDEKIDSKQNHKRKTANVST